MTGVQRIRKTLIYNFPYFYLKKKHTQIYIFKYSNHNQSSLRHEFGDWEKSGRAPAPTHQMTMFIFVTMWVELKYKLIPFLGLWCKNNPCKWQMEHDDPRKRRLINFPMTSQHKFEFRRIQIMDRWSCPVITVMMSYQKRGHVPIPFYAASVGQT